MPKSLARAMNRHFTLFVHRGKKAENATGQHGTRDSDIRRARINATRIRAVRALGAPNTRIIAESDRATLFRFLKNGAQEAYEAFEFLFEDDYYNYYPNL